MKFFLNCLLVLFSVLISAQDGLPADYLTKDFHKERRQALRELLPDNSIAVFFANPIRNRANDVDYVYHQDPNFYYLTGYKEPHAVLLIFSEDINADNENTFNEVLYVQEKNPLAEMWTGHRLGVEGAKKNLGFEKVYNGSEFVDSGINYSDFDRILFHNFHDDYRDSKGNKADLHSLIGTFKEQINYDNFTPISQNQIRIYQLIKATEVDNSANVAQTIGRAVSYYPDLNEDEIIIKYSQSQDDATRMELKQKLVSKVAENKSNLNVSLLPELMGKLREIKTEEELVLLTKAIRISAMGQREVMKAMHPNMSESEIQGIHEYVYKKYGSEYEGYPSIVGAGNNGCVLHYIENTKMKVENDLVLMDLGAEYHGYTADVTRTIPANGKFTSEQKLIYNLVYEAQEAGIKASVVGASFNEPNDVAKIVINEGLQKLGIISSVDEKHTYFPHGTSHYLGLDVHDPGTYEAFKPNTVITVEPGIYIPDGSPCDKKWWGIAVRIEDDILITENGPINLSGEAPRTVEAIENLMKESSALDDFELPNLD
ncbi:aminopeptidase P family protein [Hyunsoonleella aestuarii]|uniref:Xaa-Pro aminopeptidase n=1 Tax=Hyunsoonleella aestuarii TaxID=912802 RepID=A0ABP8EDI6_9FLAO|nr:aminopeptidase P family protein [Hyunsoonleella aestuarii]